MNIGEAIKGDAIELNGYELQITGGSDFTGMPMMKHIEGAIRKSLLLGRGPGAYEIKKPGIRLRKTVAGNTISATTAQINLKVAKAGTKSVPELWGIQPKEETKKEIPVEQKQEAKPVEKKEAKVAVKKEEKKE